MTDSSSRPGEADGPERSSHEYEYFGPFGPAHGSQQASGMTQPGMGYGPAYLSGPELFPAPAGVPHVLSREATTANRPQAVPQQRAKPGVIFLVAGLVALIVGASAGFGGDLLANWYRGNTPETTAPVISRGPVPPAPAEADTVKVARLMLPSTVTIRAGSGGSGATGSGFVLDKEGRIMTNNHVVAGAADGGEIEVRFTDGQTASAEILGRSPSYDLAVIKVEASQTLVPVQLGDSGATQVGETAIAVGSPLGLGGTVTEGIISSKDRPVVVAGESGADSASAYINAIQTDAPINPGNSGGPLVDAGGRVIGVNSAILTMGRGGDGQTGSIGLGFAIPINQAVQIGDMLIKDGKATYPVIGATVSNDQRDFGVELAGVEAGGPADEAGLRNGDVVFRIDEVQVLAAEELIVTIRTHRPGDVVTLEYERGGREASAKVTLGSREG